MPPTRWLISESQPPAAAFEDVYENNYNGSLFGGLASGVPGELRGLQYIHENYGILPWKDVLGGPINTARYGWHVTEDLVKYMTLANASALVPNFFCAEPARALDFCPDGILVGLGDVMTRKQYADTLEVIANEGPDAFYHGAVAETTIAALQAQNGIMTLDDLANYTAVVRRAYNVSFGE
ncbi:nucleophile aminohydrolase [Xylogone sp. PMI_703]|nr:nucleophile aminohydrolase [Xylogone sp. PMI_703]